MSSEIQVNVSLKASNSNLKYASPPWGTLMFDQTSQVAIGGVQVIGTATNAEFLAIGDVTTAGWCILRNLDSTNYVDVGTRTGTDFYATMRLNAGEIALLPLHPTNVPSAKANSAAVNLQYQILSR